MGDESFKRPLVQAFDEIFGPARVRFEREREGGRIADMVKRFNEYERADKALTQAQIAYANGNTQCFDETVIGPTPEQLLKAEYEPVEAKRDDGWQAKQAMTVHRKIMSHALTFYHKGVIDDTGLQACRWYKDVYEASGLIGNIPSTDFTKEVFAAPQSRSMFSDWQIDMQGMWRAARLEMTAKWLPFFDAVVLHDVSPRVAIRLARKRNGTEVGLFRDVVSELTAAYDTLKKVV